MALDGLLRADADLANLGERGFRSTVQATLAQVYARLGDPTRARAAIELAEELGAADDLLNIVLAATARTHLALIDHDPDTAERWARLAVEHALRTDFVALQGDAQLELAHVLSTRGRKRDAMSVAHAALELFQAKRDIPRARRARMLIEQLDCGHHSCHAR